MASEEPVHAALVRPILVLGIERPLALAAIGLAVLLPLAGDLHLLPLALAGGIVFVLFPVLRKAAKYDPILSKVYSRHLTYQGFYPANTPFDAPPATIRAFHEGVY